MLTQTKKKIIEEFREYMSSNGEQNDWNFDDAVDDAENFLITSLDTLEKEVREEIKMRLLPFVTATGTPLKPIEGGYDKVVEVIDSLDDKNEK